MSFPKLPPLDDLDSNVSEINNLNNQIGIKENSQANFKVSLELPELDDLNDEIFTDEDLMLESNIKNDENKNDFSEDFTQVKDLENVEETLEEQLEFEEEFLPIVNQEVLPTMNNMEDESEVNKEFPSKIKHKYNKDKGFKEIDEEFIKNFFLNMKDKIRAFKNKLFKYNKFKEVKDKKISKSSQHNKIINILLSILKVVGIMITLAGITFAIISFVLKTSSLPLADISYEVKGEEAVILIDKIKRHEEGIELTFKNQGDISTSFFTDIEFSSKDSLFKKNKFICQSDIIFLEPGKELKETMKCENFIEADEYSIEVNLKEIK